MRSYDFEGGKITSDGGVLLLREIDEKLKLTEKAAKLIDDSRDRSKVERSVLTMLRQRVYGIASGYEDLNGHDNLRHDQAFQVVLNLDKNPGSSPTLCRFENSVEKETSLKLSELLVEHFMDSFEKPPGTLNLDFDPTDDIVRGKQENSFYNSYYGDYCFLPLYVFCDSQLLVSCLRPSNIDGAKRSRAILSLLVRAFRKRWPDVYIIARSDLIVQPRQSARSSGCFLIEP